MTRGILSLFLITTLLAVVRATPESNIIYKRQSSQYCNGGIGLANGDLYCAPKANDTFSASTTIKFAWNTEDGEIKTKGYIDVYLFRNEDLTMVYSNITVDNNLQILPIKVDSSWFATSPGPQPKTVEFFFRVAASGSSVWLAPQGPIFQIIEPAEQSVAAPIPATTTISDTNLPSATTIVSSEDKNTTFTPPLVAIVCVAGVTALVAIIALVMAARSRRARSNKSMSTLSTSSTTPMVMDSKYNNSRDVESPVDVASISSVTPLSKKESQPNIAQRISLSSPSRSSLTGNPSVTFSSVSSAGALSVSDAAFLSDAFRHGLRKPEWGADVDDDEDDDEVEELTEEEKRLRKEAKELMKKELAEEGTGLQSVSRKQARIEIMNAKDLLTEGEFEGDNKES